MRRAACDARHAVPVEARHEGGAPVHRRRPVALLTVVVVPPRVHLTQRQHTDVSPTITIRIMMIINNVMLFQTAVHYACTMSPYYRKKKTNNFFFLLIENFQSYTIPEMQCGPATVSVTCPLSETAGQW